MGDPIDLLGKEEGRERRKQMLKHSKITPTHYYSCGGDRKSEDFR